MTEHKCIEAGGYALFKEEDSWYIDEGDRYPEVDVNYCPWCGIKLDA